MKQATGCAIQTRQRLVRRRQAEQHISLQLCQQITRVGLRQLYADRLSHHVGCTVA
jgi:hypothetical protein